VSETPPSSTEAFVAAFGLALDAAAAEVVQAFDDDGIRSILLRGPALSRLYDRARPYGDVDLLVSPADARSAERILAALGFEPPPDIVHYRPPHADTWRRSDGMKVDLHRCLVGVAGEPAHIWDLLAKHTERIEVGGREVEVLDGPGQALELALHAAQHGVRVDKPLRDLTRALAQLPPDVWEAAAALAESLAATPAFSTGLRLLPAGRVIAARLGLPEATTAEIALRARTPVPMSRGFARLARTPGLRAKVALVARELVPEAEFMRIQSPLARRGRLGLLVAYLWRPLWLARHAIPALRAWRSAKRESLS
jgi:hypothetical protein